MEKKNQKGGIELKRKYGWRKNTKAGVDLKQHEMKLNQ